MSATSFQNSPTDPIATMADDAVLLFWSAQAGSRGITTDAAWTTAMNTLFSAANFPGIDATALAFIRSFFAKLCHLR